MLRSNLPRSVRYLRRRRGWRQFDLGARCGVSRQVISRVERGELSGIRLRTINRILETLGAAGELTVRWQGERLDRLVDASHAAVVEAAAELLRSAGWMTRAEVSFNHYGDRGRVDLLAIHPATRTLLVVEAKSAIGNVQETVGRVDVKVRLGSTISASVGWGEPANVVGALVIGETRTARRIVHRHATTFSRYELRGRAALAWLRRPQAPGPSGVLWFVSLPDSLGAGTMRSKRMRTDGSGA